MRLVKPSSAAALALIAALMAVTMLVPPSRSAQAQGQGSWGAQTRVTNSNRIEFFPEIAIDSQGNAHVVYEDTEDVNASRRAMYTRLKGGTWSTPIQISLTGQRVRSPKVATVTIGSQVRVGIVYQATNTNVDGNRIFFRLSADGGDSFSGPEQLPGGAPSYGPALTFDDVGNAHVAFSSAPGNVDFSIVYTTRTVGWSGLRTISNENDDYNIVGNIVTTTSGGVGSVHIGWVGGRNGDEVRKGVYYSKKTGTGDWARPRFIQTPGGASGPDLVTDGANKLFAVYHANLSDSSYDPYFLRSLDNGDTWSGQTNVGRGAGGVLDVMPAIARSRDGGLVVVWESTEADDGRRDIYSRFSSDEGAAFTGIRTVYRQPGTSREVDVAGSVASYRAVWHDDGGGRDTYRVWTAVALSNAISIQAQPSVENGAAATKNTTVSVGFSGVVGDPKELRWRWNAAPTDSQFDSPGTNGWTTYANPKPVPVASGLPECTPQTLYTQVRNGALVSVVQSDAIAFDRSVQADVRVMNPKMPGLPSTYSGPAVQDVLGQGASNGDPRYTRERIFVLQVSDNGDCTGIASATVGTQTFNVENGLITASPSLPGNDAPGPKTFSVAVADALGTTVQFPNQQLIYDPPTGKPVLSSGGSVEDADPSRKSVVRRLSFSNIKVNDDQYGKHGENLPAGKQFWGVWIANSREDNDQGDTTLNWYPIQVPTPGDDGSFELDWSVFGGLSSAQKAYGDGRFYVYVRFLDGAGNPSDGFVKAVVELPEDYTLPTSYAVTIRN